MDVPPISQQYENANVTIYYNSTTSYSDTGKIGYMDATWIELIKGNDRFLIPIVAIRLIKLLEAPPGQRGGDILLRPAQSQPKSIPQKDTQKASNE